KRMGVATWRLFIEDIQAGAYALEPTTEADLVRATELEEQYDDLGLGFVDAAVIALCERLREPKVATVDYRDFGVVVPRHVPSLELLPR
ncbi:MAG: PIN domain-containing protein, partial [Dehalococcoidia bacterium]